MKRIFIFIFSLFLFYSNSNAQCKGFAKNVCKLQLLPYIHDGVYNATVLSEGESAELFKTFYSGQEYRLAVCADSKLGKIQFEVLDGQRNVLFSNKDKGYATVWDFKLQSSQQLIIVIQVPTSDQVKDKIASGCVAVLIGFMNNENSFEQF